MAFTKNDDEPTSLTSVGSEADSRSRGTASIDTGLRPHYTHAAARSCVLAPNARSQTERSLSHG
jgi:hypothetical protein